MSERRHQYDYLVIGGGSAGVRSARIAAGLGANVALVESNRLGGTCVNRGCVPKKHLFYAAEALHGLEHARDFGIQVATGEFSWPLLIENIHRDRDRLNSIYQRLLDESRVDFYPGEARFIAQKEIQVGHDQISAKHILIAVGGKPRAPDNIEPGAYITSREFFELEHLPQTLVVVGGGYIALELASAAVQFGVEVHVVVREHILSTFDSEWRRFLLHQLQAKGISFHLQTEVLSIDKPADTAGSRKVHLSDGTAIETESVLYAIGREPNISPLGLEGHLAIELDADGLIKVDDGYETSTPGVYACGDVIAGPQLTPTAIAQGHHLAERLFGQGIDKKTDYIPTAVFTSPEAATVGISGGHSPEAYDVYRSVFRPMQWTLGHRQTKTFMKLVVRSKDDRVVGAHMVGPGASEMIQLIAVAMNAGATKKDFDTTLAIHPTAAEEFVTMRTPTTEEWSPS